MKILVQEISNEKILPRVYIKFLFLPLPFPLTFLEHVKVELISRQIFFLPANTEMPFSVERSLNISVLSSVNYYSVNCITVHVQKPLLKQCKVHFVS